MWTNNPHPHVIFVQLFSEAWELLCTHDGLNNSTSQVLLHQSWKTYFGPHFVHIGVEAGKCSGLESSKHSRHQTSSQTWQHVQKSGETQAHAEMLQIAQTTTLSTNYDMLVVEYLQVVLENYVKLRLFWWDISVHGCFLCLQHRRQTGDTHFQLRPPPPPTYHTYSE